MVLQTPFSSHCFVFAQAYQSLLRLRWTWTVSWHSLVVMHVDLPQFLMAFLGYPRHFALRGVTQGLSGSHSPLRRRNFPLRPVEEAGGLTTMLAAQPCSEVPFLPH